MINEEEITTNHKSSFAVATFEAGFMESLSICRQQIDEINSLVASFAFIQCSCERCHLFVFFFSFSSPQDRIYTYIIWNQIGEKRKDFFLKTSVSVVLCQPDNRICQVFIFKFYGNFLIISSIRHVIGDPVIMKRWRIINAGEILMESD